MEKPPPPTQFPPEFLKQLAENSPLAQSLDQESEETMAAKVAKFFGLGEDTKIEDLDLPRNSQIHQLQLTRKHFLRIFVHLIERGPLTRSELGKFIGYSTTSDHVRRLIKRFPEAIQGLVVKDPVVRFKK